MNKHIKNFLQVLAERITDTNCINCKHCIDNITCDSLERYEKCCSTIYPKYFEKK